MQDRSFHDAHEDELARLRHVLSATCEGNRRLAILKEELAETLAEVLRATLVPADLHGRALGLIAAAGVCAECARKRCVCPTQ